MHPKARRCTRVGTATKKPEPTPIRSISKVTPTTSRISQQLQHIAILTRQSASQLATVLSIKPTDMATLEHLITDGPLAPTDDGGQTIDERGAGRMPRPPVPRTSSCSRSRVPRPSRPIGRPLGVAYASGGAAFGGDVGRGVDPGVGQTCAAHPAYSEACDVTAPWREAVCITAKAHKYRSAIDPAVSRGKCSDTRRTAAGPAAPRRW